MVTISNIKSIKTQKTNSMDCGPIAIVNYLSIIGIKNKYSLNKVKKEIQCHKKEGSFIVPITNFLDKILTKEKDNFVCTTRIEDPTLNNLKKVNKPMILLVEYKSSKNSHFSTLAKSTDKYLYLTNWYCSSKKTFVKMKKVSIDKFKKEYNIFFSLY